MSSSCEPRWIFPALALQSPLLRTQNRVPWFCESCWQMHSALSHPRWNNTSPISENNLSCAETDPRSQQWKKPLTPAGTRRSGGSARFFVSSLLWTDWRGVRHLRGGCRGRIYPLMSQGDKILRTLQDEAEILWRSREFASGTGAGDVDGPLHVLLPEDQACCSGSGLRLFLDFLFQSHSRRDKVALLSPDRKEEWHRRLHFRRGFSCLIAEHTVFSLFPITDSYSYLSPVN